MVLFFGQSWTLSVMFRKSEYRDMGVNDAVRGGGKADRGADSKSRQTGQSSKTRHLSYYTRRKAVETANKAPDSVGIRLNQC